MQDRAFANVYKGALRLNKIDPMTTPWKLDTELRSCARARLRKYTLAHSVARGATEKIINVNFLKQPRFGVLPKKVTASSADAVRQDSVVNSPCLRVHPNIAAVKSTLCYAAPWTHLSGNVLFRISLTIQSACILKLHLPNTQLEEAIYICVQAHVGVWT